MKKLGLILFLAGTVSITSYAQDTDAQRVKDNWPYWTISKGVHKVAIKNVVFTPAVVTVGDVANTSSKGIHRVSAERSSERTAKVKTTGYPTWTISKGVARMQAEKRSDN